MTHSLVNVWKKNDLTLNNDDLCRDYFLFQKENFLKEGNNQICFYFGGHDALNCKFLKKNPIQQ